MPGSGWMLRLSVTMVLGTLACSSSDVEPSGGGAGQTGQTGQGSGAAGNAQNNGGTAAVGTAGAGQVQAGSGGVVGVAGTTGGGGSTSPAGTGGMNNGSGATGGSGGGGVAGSGGTNDAGASGSGGASGSCLPSYLLCEDFEGTAAGMIPDGWLAHGEASVADDEAHGGQHALKISPAENGERRIVHDASMLGAQHWGRVYYKVQLPVPEAFVHSTLVSMHGIGPNVGEAEFRFVDTVKDAAVNGFAMGNHQFLFNVQPNGAEFGMGTNYDYTFDGEWHCVEWHVDAADQSYHFLYEGEDVLNFTHGAGNFDDSELPDTFDEVRVGWNNYQGAPPGFTAWIDDFALAEERINCLP